MRALLVLVALATLAHADASTTLRDGNTAASNASSPEEWANVAALIEPLLAQQLSKPDQAEAYRLAGLAAFFTARYELADTYFFEYLKRELDGQLDPSTYPPEVVSFFARVRQNHYAELRALRPKPKGSIWLSLLPPIGQFQNGEKVKGIVVGSALGAFLVTSIASYVVLRNWCTQVAGSSGSSATCDDGGDRYRSAQTLQTVNLVAGIGFAAMYVYGLYDGVTGYRRRTREMAAMPMITGSTVGVSIAW